MRTGRFMPVVEQRDKQRRRQRFAVVEAFGLASPFSTGFLSGVLQRQDALCGIDSSGQHMSRNNNDARIEEQDSQYIN